jgi:hypothetical protein
MLLTILFVVIDWVCCINIVTFILDGQQQPFICFCTYPNVLRQYYASSEVVVNIQLLQPLILGINLIVLHHNFVDELNKLPIHITPQLAVHKNQESLPYLPSPPSSTPSLFGYHLS